MGKKRKNDILLIGALLLLAAAVLLGVSLLKGEGAYALVTTDGGEHGRYPLSQDAEIRIGEGTHENVLLIKDGAASVCEASCPDKLCMGMGAIRYSGQSIICLPNRVVVEIIGGESGGEDAVAR